MGYLKGGFDAWKKAGKEIDSVTSISAKEFEEVLKKDKKVPVFDVRKETEYNTEYLIGAVNTPLDILNDYQKDFPKNETFYLHCAGGYRSMIAASILKSRGFHNLVDVAGGFSAIKKTNLPVTQFACTSK